MMFGTKAGDATCHLYLLPLVATSRCYLSLLPLVAYRRETPTAHTSGGSETIQNSIWGLIIAFQKSEVD